MTRAAGRFDLQETLGSGSFGVVYAAWDRVLHERVALKLVRHADPAAIAALKAEFRLVADVWHPNLAAVHGLFVERGECLISMELVDGAPLSATLSGTPSSQPPGLATPRGEVFTADPDAVRDMLAQVVCGIAALHEAGIVHRDIKPSHLLVARDGRVKLIDFGLGHALSDDDDGPAGSPAWAAPEVGAGGEVTAAADWYSLGVVLYQALTRQLPFAGDPVEVTVARQTRDPLPPDLIASGVPEDLAAICMALLRRAPARRPTGEELLRWLGRSGPVVPGRSSRSPFVGRDAEVAVLLRALDDVSIGARRLVLVSGPSGVGKTRLVRHVLTEQGQRALVLSGVSNLREVLPYKCLDPILDSLVSHLAGLSAHEVASLLPEDFDCVVELFPACGRVLPSPAGQGGTGDPIGRRGRAAAALRTLLGRLAVRQPVIVVLDDAQWGDQDSAALLAQILEPPGQPAVMVVACHRDVTDGSPVVRVLQGAGAETVTLRELAPADAERLAGQLLGTDDGADGVPLARRIATESGGMPFLLGALAQHAVTTGHEPTELSLEATIAARVARLPPGAGAALKLTAVAARPLEREVLRASLGDIHGISAIWSDLLGSQLASERLVPTGIGLDVRHDRIRDVVLADLGPGDEVRLHGVLADALAGRDPEELLAHLLGAQRWPEARAAAAQAAARALRALAFDEAARLWGVALICLDHMAHVGDGARAAAWTARGRALALAGHGKDAADAYLSAADRSPAPAAFELRRQACEQLLCSGHIGRGRALLCRMLAEVGVPFPTSPRARLARLTLLRALVRLRAALPIRAAGGDDDDALRRVLDACSSGTKGLAMVDPVAAALLAAELFLRSMGSRSPARVTMAVAGEIPLAAMDGKDAEYRTRRLERIAYGLVRRCEDPYHHGTLMVARAGAAWLEGRFAQAVLLADQGQRLLARADTPASYEIASARIMSLDSAKRLGRLRAIAGELPDLIAGARSHGDLYLECTLRVGIQSMVELAVLDDAGGARESVLDGLARWRGGPGTLLELWHLVSLSTVELYEARPDAALEVIHAVRPRAEMWGLLRPRLFRLTVTDCAGRAALASASTDGCAGRGRRLGEAREAARALSTAQWSAPLGAMIEAGVAMAEGSRDHAVAALHRAHRALTVARMELHAATVRLRLAELTEAPEAAEQARDAMRALGVRAVDRVADLLAPGPWREVGGARRAQVPSGR